MTLWTASVAQVHRAVWRSTGEKVAVKVQNPQAERLMTGDLRNLVLLARFLQKTELKFDILSALLELQKQIKNEFDFVREARNMDSAGRQLAALAPGVCVPRSLFCSKRALVMTYVEGVNLGKLQEFNASSNGLPSWAKKIAGPSVCINILCLLILAGLVTSRQEDPEGAGAGLGGAVVSDAHVPRRPSPGQHLPGHQRGQRQGQGRRGPAGLGAGQVRVQGALTGHGSHGGGH